MSGRDNNCMTELPVHYSEHEMPETRLDLQMNMTKIEKAFEDDGV